MLKSLKQIFQAQTSRFQSNPFKQIVNELPEIPVYLTIELLHDITDHLRKSNVPCKTYGDVINILKYLDEHNAIYFTLDNASLFYKIGKVK